MTGLDQLRMVGLARGSERCRCEIINRLGVDERVLGEVSQHAATGYLSQHVVHHHMRWILCLKIGVK